MKRKNKGGKAKTSSEFHHAMDGNTCRTTMMGAARHIPHTSSISFFNLIYANTKLPLIPQNIKKK
jgi:hypothetical protein